MPSDRRRNILPQPLPDLSQTSHADKLGTPPTAVSVPPNRIPPTPLSPTTTTPDRSVLYQLVPLDGPIYDRTFEISVLDPGVRVYAVTFG